MDEEHESREAVTDVELSGMNKQITNGMHKAAMMEFKHSLYKNGYLAKMDDMSVDSYDFKMQLIIWEIMQCWSVLEVS